MKIDFDGAWKDVCEHLFMPMLSLLFPATAKQIDRRYKPIFLKQELKQIQKRFPGAKGRKTVDILAKVRGKDGRETWILVHLEIQMNREADFEKRMFIYFYRIFELLGDAPQSLAILGDTHADWHPNQFLIDNESMHLDFRFSSCKLQHFLKDWSVLEKNPNPFAIAVMAHLQTLATSGKIEQRAAWKLNFLRLALKRKYTVQTIRALVEFIDWIMTVPDELNAQIDFTLETELEEETVAQLTGIRAIHFEKGKAEGKAEGIAKGKAEAEVNMLKHLIFSKFGSVPEWAVEKINKAGEDIIKKWASALLTKNSLEDALS